LEGDADLQAIPIDWPEFQASWQTQASGRNKLETPYIDSIRSTLA